MDGKNKLTKTPYLVLFIILISVGVGTASALITITLDGNVVVTGNTTLEGGLACTNCVDSADINPSQVQRRTGSMACPDDMVLKAINLDGTINCWPSFTGEAPSGIPGALGIYTIETTFGGLSTGENNQFFSIFCDEGDFALSGGIADVNGIMDEFVVKEFGNGEVEDMSSALWFVTVDVKADSFEGITIRLHAICLDFSPGHID